jgi:hypothetical protein
MSTPTLVGYDLQTRDRAPVEFGVRCTRRRRPRRPASWSSDRQGAALSGAYWRGTVGRVAWLDPSG